MPCTKMRGQGGVAVVYREELRILITICKTDAHNRYMWIKLDIKPKPMFIAGCYIPHRESPFYDAFNVEKNDPFEALYADVNTYAQEGMIMLIGDMNGRIANAQMQMVDLMTPPMLEHNEMLDPTWKRCSKDLTTNPQGIALLSMMTSLQLIAVNGTKKFEKLGECTCYTANHGKSVIDYVLIANEASHIVSNFTIGQRSSNSDHTPIHVWLMYLRGRTPQLQGWHMLVDGSPDHMEQEYVEDTMLICKYEPYTLDRLQSTLSVSVVPVNLLSIGTSHQVLWLAWTMYAVGESSRVLLGLLQVRPVDTWDFV
ncbi:hypothetical protein L7F22_051427 [Adiantum nelumboides]|nr:hypothetical protein [Adiantum nelumboides]